MRLMAIDPGQKLGWAHGVPGEKPISGVFKLTGNSRGKKLLSLEHWFVSMIRGNAIDFLWIEAPLNLQANSIDSIFSTAGIDTTLEKECARAGLYYDYVEVASWRSAFLRDPNKKTGITMAPKMTDDEIIDLLIPSGDIQAKREMKKRGVSDKNKTEARRRWLKNRTMQECAKKGFEPETDDESDALGIWWMKADEELRKAASPKFDLLGGLTI